ncbi:uncharacterized protein SAPINGB_P002185 [Magnusiomyces paraingens]|uniref:Uncharacterized protein n=1 Tax=Magnusiomyces paraingens TaxID=2606893 RepID=A0A5E8BD86_9ASCO|nr:uncharacterized protein SAPINGB_P002185 [Saprochaete ingens]VVT49264.1 unnamed protein product [Saprochaete ingens]
MAPTKEKGGSTKPVTSDPRFARVHNDPRFRIPKQRLQKVKIDERFRERLQNDEDFKKRPTVDKYGRKKNVESAEKELSKYYNLKEGDDESDEEYSEEESSEDEDEQEDKAEKKVSKPKTDEGNEDEAREAAEKLKKFRRARGEIVDDSSESSSDEDSSDESEEEDLVIEENEVPLGDETTTFAAVNMDWDNIRAVDLMATFSSFVPPNGRIEWVRIYPSEYGKEKMNQEAVSGPPRDLFKSKNKKEESDSEDEEEDKPLFEVDNGEDVESNSLRKYQLQRLRYYYAVVKCNSIGTARSIYDNCDGAEYEATANLFDLRYIPEGETFEDKPRDECTLVPANYQPPNYATDALRHSKVRLTWDETPVERMQFAAKAFSRKEIEDMDVKAYLASDSEEEEDDDKEQKKNLYKSLLGQSDYSAVFNGEDKDDVDMEITFTPGLDEKKKTEEEVEETTIEKYKRKMKERRKKHQDKIKEEKEVEKEEKSKKKGKKGKKEKEDEETSKETAELELLMTEDGGEKRLDHFNMKEIMKAEKQLKKKGKKGKKGAEEMTAPAGLDFKLDVNDERFQALYEDHDFAIDPTKPQFKKTQNMDRLMDERRKRAAEHAEDDSEAAPAPKKKGKSAFDAEKKQKKQKLEAGDQSLSALVDKVKRRARAGK